LGETVRYVTGHLSNGLQEGKVMARKAKERNFDMADEVRDFPKGILERRDP